MCLTTEGFRDITARLLMLADEVCDGRIVAIQEGGYSESYAPYCALAIMEMMAGVRTGTTEPMTPERIMGLPPHREIGLSGEEALGRIGDHYAQFWPSLR